MIQIENISRAGREVLSGRRDFLKGMRGASAFVLSVRWMPEQLFAASANANPAHAMSKAALQPNVYLAIDTDGTAYIIAHRSEIGRWIRPPAKRIRADGLGAVLSLV